MYNNVLILDTNILLDLIKPDIYDKEVFDKLVHSLIINKTQLVMPQQVLKEWLKHNDEQEKIHEDKVKEDIKKYFEILDHLDDEEEKKIIGETLNKLSKYKIRMYRYVYGKRNEKLKTLIIDHEKGLIINKGNITDSLVIDFALEKKAPFFSNEFNGAKTKTKTEAADAVIFFTVYENIKNNLVKSNKVYFVTNNHKDYSEPNNPSKIHANLEVYAEEVGLIFSNSLEKVLDEILDGKIPEIEYSPNLEELKWSLRDSYFENCDKCGGEVHINADSFIGSEKKAYETTYWLKCRCGNKWSTWDLVSEQYGI